MTRRRRRWRRCVLWRCVAPSATSPPGARQCAGAGGSATRSGPRHHPQTFLSRCRAATPPAARAVLLLLAAPKSLRTAAGVQLQGGLRRRHARQPHDGAPARQLRAQLKNCAGASGALVVWSLGGRQARRGAGTPGPLGPSPAAVGATPGPGGGGRVPSVTVAPREALVFVSPPFTPYASWCVGHPPPRPDGPPGGRTAGGPAQSSGRAPYPCALGAPPGPVVAGGLRLSASGAGRAPCHASPPHPS